MREYKYMSTYVRLSSDLTARESILLWSSSMVCDLDSSSLVQGIMVEVEVGPLVEAVMNWLCCGRSKVGMDIRETLQPLVSMMFGVVWFVLTGSTKALRLVGGAY